MSRRQVRVTKEQNAECQRLLRLMGIPVIMVRPRSMVTFPSSSLTDCPPPFRL